ncbi:MAG: hypothetical protein H7X77_05385 [Anaerolineae bacterium]|nr:hypothetical protein [Anaerolineae bacterium]
MMKITGLLRLLWLVLIALLVTGCGEGAVIFAPTPLPPDLSPLRYEHPSGVFTVSVPRNWSVYTQNTPNLAAATFAPPDSGEPLLTFAVINLGQPVDAAQIGELTQQYQTLHRPDLKRYTPQDRQAMGDGSWRLTGYRTLPGGGQQPVNTFVEFSATFVAVTDVVMPRDGALQADLQNAINTFRLNPAATLQISELSTLSFVRRSPLEVQNIATWQNTAGVFFVTGEVANNSETPVFDVPVQVQLLNADGTPAADAADLAMGYGIPAGGFAPFSLRFGGGQPAGSTRYTITLGTPVALETPRLFYGAETLTWTDDSEFADDGALIIDGTVTNTSTLNLHDPMGIVTVFDAQQQVIAAWFSPLAAPVLAPGAVLDFEIRIPEVGGDPVNYILDIQALADE